MVTLNQLMPDSVAPSMAPMSTEVTREYVPAGYHNLFLFHRVSDALGPDHWAQYGRFDNTSDRFWYKIMVPEGDAYEVAAWFEYDAGFCKVTTFKGTSQGARERMDLVDSVLSEKGYVPR